MKYQHEPPSPRQDPATPVARSRSTGNRTHSNIVDNSFSREADVTARIYSSSSSLRDSSVEEVTPRRHQQQMHQRATRRHHRRSDRDRQRTRPTHADDKMAATVALLKSELQATRSQVEQKEVVTRSLQRQLDQVSSSQRSKMPIMRAIFLEIVCRYGGAIARQNRTPSSKCMAMIRTPWDVGYSTNGGHDLSTTLYRTAKYKSHAYNCCLQVSTASRIVLNADDCSVFFVCAHNSPRERCCTGVHVTAARRDVRPSLCPPSVSTCQRGEIETQTQAQAEEDLVAALAKASGLKEELARTSQLLVKGAVGR